MNQLTIRKIHRWLGLIAGIQLLAWTISGLYFTLIPIDEIRGSHLVVSPDASPVIGDVEIMSLAEIAALHPQLAESKIDEVQLTAPDGEPVYLIDDSRISATTGVLLGHLSEESALSIVSRRLDRKVEVATWMTEAGPHSEYRGGELPAWAVEFDDNVTVYVGATSGRIRAVRTNEWRIFDFLWMLHIMDYEAREDFNHLLIQTLSVLGLITVITGLILFFMTQTWGRRNPG